MFHVEHIAIDPELDEGGGVLREAPVGPEIRAVPRIGRGEGLDDVLALENLRVAIRPALALPHMLVCGRVYPRKVAALLIELIWKPRIVAPRHLLDDRLVWRIDDKP